MMLRIELKNVHILPPNVDFKRNIPIQNVGDESKASFAATLCLRQRSVTGNLLAKATF